MELVEKYRYKPKEVEPNLVEGTLHTCLLRQVDRVLADIIAGLRHSTVQHNYWVSSPHRPQYFVRALCHFSACRYLFCSFEAVCLLHACI